MIDYMQTTTYIPGHKLVEHVLTSFLLPTHNQSSESTKQFLYLVFWPIPQLLSQGDHFDQVVHCDKYSK